MSALSNSNGRSHSWGQTRSSFKVLKARSVSALPLGLFQEVKPNRIVLSEISKLQNIKTVCELGCGNGCFANQLASLGYQVTAVDLSDSGIAQAQKDYGHNVQFIRASIDRELSTKLAAKKFDLVLAKEVIEHLYRPANLLETALELLKPGGFLLMTTPYHGYLKNLVISLLGHTDQHYNPLWDGGHIKFFSPKTLRKLAEQANFKHIRFRFWGRIPKLLYG